MKGQYKLFTDKFLDENAMTSKSMNWTHQKLTHLLVHKTRLEAGVLLILQDYAETEVEISNFEITETGMGLG